MTSVEAAVSSKPEPEPEFQKFSLRRLEPSIQKFLKVIQIDLQRLHKHKLNIEQYNKHCDWTSLHNEQVNAARTVQQVKANIREIEKTRNQVLQVELEKFDARIDGMKRSAIEAVMEFVDVANEIQRQNQTPFQGEKLADKIQPSQRDSESPSSDMDLQDTIWTGSVQTTQHKMNLLPENSEVAQSWEHLQEDLEGLNAMIHEFATVVQSQGEKIDRIEDNIENAQESVAEGTYQLGKAAKYKAAVFPIAGAVIGTLVGGPVGFLAGLKVGAVAGAVGGGAGFVGGRVLRKRQDKITDTELNNMSERCAESISDMPPEEEDSFSSWLPSSWRQRSSKSESDNG